MGAKIVREALNVNYCYLYLLTQKTNLINSEKMEGKTHKL